MKLKASLEAVKTRKDASSDIVQTVVLNVFARPDELAELMKFYQQPIEIEITEVKQ